MYKREIVYSREDRDYACYLDTGSGPELVCFARTYSEGERTLDALVLELIQATPIPASDWGTYNTGSIETCACDAPAAVLLHGVCENTDIALCETCYTAYAHE